MSKKPIITAAEAASWVKDGDTITTSGFVASGMPEALTKALEQRFLETGSPKNLTLYYAATDNIPAEQFKAAWFDPTRKVLSEKIVGTADTTISQIWTSEAPLYGMGQQDLDTTMQNILDRSNEAIKEAELY